MNKSVDKCMGDTCACKAKPIRIIRGPYRPQVISFNPGPPAFPGTGGIQMVSDIQRDRRIRERAAYYAETLGRHQTR